MPEKFKTYEGVFDNFTNRNLFRLASQGYFEELQSPIALGKEANVFSAVRKDGKKVIVKIYRLETCDFNRMYDYIRSDERYQNIRRKKRSVVFAWTQREFRNLHKARDAGVTVPTPYHFSNNILIEEFIGDKQPAPPLKDCGRMYFDEIVENMKKLYKGGLVHGDLSQFNVLVKDKPYLIDFSQATSVKSFNSRELLERDVRNIAKYFSKGEDEIWKMLGKI